MHQFVWAIGGGDERNDARGMLQDDILCNKCVLIYDLHHGRDSSAAYCYQFEGVFCDIYRSRVMKECGLM